MTDEAEVEAPLPAGAAKWTAKHDATTRAAMDIIERERAAEDAKTARLKATRMAREAEQEESR